HLAPALLKMRLQQDHAPSFRARRRDMTDTDDPLVQRVRKRDVAALGEFLERRRPQLLAYIERNLGEALRRKLEPVDIFQEVSVSAVQALPTFELGERDPFGWLCHLAEERIIDAHRRFFGTQKR